MACPNCSLTFACSTVRRMNPLAVPNGLRHRNNGCDLKAFVQCRNGGRATCQDSVFSNRDVVESHLKQGICAERLIAPERKAGGFAVNRQNGCLTICC